MVTQPVGIIVAEQHEGSAPHLNLALVQNPWARTAASERERLSGARISLFRTRKRL